MSFMHYDALRDFGYSAVSVSNSKNHHDCDGNVTVSDPKYNDSDGKARGKVTLIVGRRPHRIHLDENLAVDKIHFSIRTSGKFHHSKMDPLILTWLQTATPSNVSSFKGVYVAHTAYFHALVGEGTEEKGVVLL